MEDQPQISSGAAGPLLALITALRDRRPLLFTGEVLVQLDQELGDELGQGQATMVLDAADLAAIELALGSERVCRGCGCTETNACVFLSKAFSDAAPGGRPTTCHWIEEDLCSACDPAAPADVAARWQHPSERAAA